MSERQFKLNEKQVGELRRASTESPDSETQTRFQAVRLDGTDYPVLDEKSIRARYAFRKEVHRMTG